MSQSHQKAVLVTGAAGFIGRRLIKALVHRGTRVIATDVVGHVDLPCPYYQADIRDTLRHAPVILRDCDAIIHAGGISGPMVWADNPSEVFDINLRGTLGLLSLAHSAGLRRFVGLSSVSAFGDAKGHAVMDEATPLSASNAYGTSKAASDLMVQSYTECYGLSAAALRVGWVYGPGRVTDAVLQPLIRSAQGQAYQLETGADHPLQFVHVDDVVAAIIAALDAPALASSSYVITGDEIYTIGEIAKMVKASLPSINYDFGPGPLAGTEVHGRLDCTRAKAELNWQPQVPFATGLAQYVAWLQEHPV